MLLFLVRVRPAAAVQRNFGFVANRSELGLVHVRTRLVTFEYFRFGFGYRLEVSFSIGCRYCLLWASSLSKRTE